MSTGRGVIHKKAIVEDCQKLTVSLLKNVEIQQALESGQLEGLNCGAAVLKYTVGKKRIETKVSLTSTPCRFGGYRVWFLCPSCGRRVGVLYRPYFATEYLCRHCHALSYYARQLRRSTFESVWRFCQMRKRLKQILEGVGRKGFSKLEKKQLLRYGIRVPHV